jgi:hypothetical protein
MGKTLEPGRMSSLPEMARALGLVYKMLPNAAR